MRDFDAEMQRADAELGTTGRVFADPIEEIPAAALADLSDRTADEDLDEIRAGLAGE